MKKCRTLTSDLDKKIKVRNLSEWLRFTQTFCTGRIKYETQLKGDGLYLYSDCQRCRSASRWKIADIKRNRKGEIESLTPIS